MLTIYLSSTYEDLKDYRHVVHDALRKAGYYVIAMDDYVAKDMRPVDKCLNDVKKADIYVGLIGFRYGFIPPPEHNNLNGLSITELEYRCAEAHKKPCLVFLAKSDAMIPLNYVDAYTGEGKKGESIKEFRHHLLKEKLASQFSTPHELSTYVLAAAAKSLADSMQAGPDKSLVTESSEAITWDIVNQGSPYPGLMHFRRKNAPVFFGRDAEVRDVLDRMHGPHGRFIIVSGSSGVGKSSLIDAGILPKLERGGLPGGARCECVRMVPSQGTDPWSSLLDAIGSLVTCAGLSPKEIEEALRKNPESLSAHLTAIIKDSLGNRQLVLFLDQMEELFTSQDLTKARRFLAAMYRVTQEKLVWVLASIRSDHLHYCHDSANMRAVLGGNGHYPVGPIEPYMVQDLIVKPARCAGVRVSEKLAHQIVCDTGADPGNLPLLAFLLNQLFEKRRDHELTDEAYGELRGVAGAIKQHAEQVEGSIEGERALERLPMLFQALVMVNIEGVPMRRRPFVSEFPPEMSGLIKTLVDARLLHTEGVDSGSTVSISHEKLFEAWPSLRDYVEANKKRLIDQRLLESRAKKWEELSRPWFAGLASGREYRDFRNSGSGTTALTKGYLHASRRATWIKSIAVVMVMLLLAIGALDREWLLRLQSMIGSIHIVPEMVTVSAGTFQQGSVDDSERQPIHEVTIKAFKIGKYEVTFEQYDPFVIATRRRKPDDYGWGRGSRPVIDVSWEDARAYAEWLSQQTRQHYRLPTESEWEYAARSEGKNQRWAGTSEEGELRDYAVYFATSKGQTEPVGTYYRERRANGLGLYDMSGNVWEWVQDCWHENYTNAPINGSPWLGSNGGNCGLRVVRGGSWQGAPGDLRASHRGRDAFSNRTSAIGFRLVQDP